MLFNGVLIGLELREFDRMCAMQLGIPTLTKSCFGKKSELRGFDSRPTICVIERSTTMTFLLNLDVSNPVLCLKYIDEFK